MNHYFLISLFFLVGCAAGIKERPDKMDALLRQKIAAVEKSKSSEAILILGKCSRAIDEPIKQALRQTGAELGSVAGAVFTASATAAQVRALTALEVVEQLQLSVERDRQLP